MRRLLLLLVLSLVVVPGPASGADGVPVVVVDGKGHGHGVGMAQDGAFWMAKDGATTPQVLAHFYPGTAVGKASGDVRVVVLPPAATNEAVLAFPRGGEVRDSREAQQSPGFPVAVPAGGRVLVRYDGVRYTVTRADATPASYQIPETTTTSSTTTTTTTTVAPSTSTTTSTTTTTTTSSTTAPSTTVGTAPRPTSMRPLWAVPVAGGVVTVPARGRHYRGLVEATAAGSPLRLVNHLDVETYLRGMGEVRDPTWPPAALRAQAIAARTYALRAMTFGGELCDDQRCQVYLGNAAEYRAMDKAVSDTKGQVVVFRNRLASAVYSSNGGGVSASRHEGFGTPEADDSHPYLRSTPYTTGDPRPWTVQVALSDVATRLQYSGQVTDVRVLRTGPSGRAVEILLDGTAGQQVVSGIAFDRALGLRSTLFTLQLATSDSPPPPPPDDDGGYLQALPDDVSTLMPVDLPAIPSQDAFDQSVPPAVETPLVVDVAAGDSAARRWFAGALGLLSLLLGAATVLGWGVARRAGMSARALRF